MPNLSHLKLNNNELSTIKGIENFKSLKSLNLAKNKIKISDEITLKFIFGEVEELDLSFNEGIMDY